MGCHFLLQGIFLTQGSNPCLLRLLHWQVEWNRKLRRKSQVKASWEQRPNGTYTVRLSLDDDVGNVMDLKLMAVREDMAKILAARFQKAPEKLYTEIMSLLLHDTQD